MRIGVVGCGYWGSKHVRALHATSGVDEVSAIDPDPVRRHELARLYPALGQYADLDDALAEIDALVVATPPRTHHPLAMRALRAGKHVLLEKPLATAVTEATELVETADDAGATLMVGHTFEYNPNVALLRRTIDSGELGDLFYIDAARLNLGLYQRDVNVVWDLAPHDVSIVNHLLDAEPTEVQAWGSAHAHPDLEDVAYLRLAYDTCGVTAHIHVSWLDPHKVRRVTVVGSRKMAVYNDVATNEAIRIYDKGVLPTGDGSVAGGVPMSYRHGAIVAPFVTYHEPLLAEDEHFVECVRTGRRPDTDGRNGLAVVSVLEGAQRSLATGRPVRLEPSGALVGR